MTRKTLLLILFMGLCIFILDACNSGAEQPKINPTQGAQMLAGTYATTITAEDVSNFSISKDPALAGNQGDWRFVLTSDGKLTADMN